MKQEKSLCCNADIEIHGEGILSNGKHYKLESCTCCGKDCEEVFEE